jgi:hypothetical protein
MTNKEGIMNMILPWVAMCCAFCSGYASVSSTTNNMSAQPEILYNTLTPTDEELHLLGELLSKTFDDGFQLTDLVIIVEGINQYLENHYLLSLSDKRDAAIKVINHIIDITDTPSLPDFYFDPIFKAFVPKLVAIMYPANKAQHTDYIISGIPSLEDAERALNGFFSQLSDGFTLDDIPPCISYVTNFASAYVELSTEEKAFAAKALLARVIDETDTPYLPDFIFDDIFKNLGNHIIDYLVKNHIIQ